MLNPQPRARAVAGIGSILAERFPRLAGIGIAEAWSGVIKTTPDAVPVIDEAETLPGFYVATGLGGHGFGIGPGTGKATAPSPPLSTGPLTHGARARPPGG